MSVPTVSLPLLGREDSLARLFSLLDGVRAGAGGAIRIEGTPGVGKSALLDAAAPADLTVLRAVGVEAEAGLALAGLEDLLHGLGAAESPARTASGRGADGATEAAALFAAAGARTRSPCCARFRRGWQRRRRWSAWSTTSSGSTPPRAPRSPTWRGGPSGSGSA